MQKLIENIKENEGFVAKPYIDVLVVKNPEAHGIPREHLKIIEQHLDKLKLTFGYGFTFITKEEASASLELRTKSVIKELEQREPFVNKLPIDKQEILVEMCYQMGVSGVLKFKKMWEALKEFNYIEASAQMLDSSWAKQTPNRALSLSKMMKKN